MYNKFAFVANKYLALEKQSPHLCILIAKNPDELKVEGKALHHCVGRMNYDQKFLREESLIFFVRNKQNLSEPLVTLEYSLENKKILQCYGVNNSTPSDEILRFVNKSWLPFTKRQLKKIS